jgi:hypothetical protein
VIGAFYSCSAVAGVVGSLRPLNKSFMRVVTIWLPAPKSYYFFLVGCTYMALLTVIPYFAVYMVGFLLVNFFLGLFISFLTELQGRISTNQNYKKLAPYGQMGRRVSGLVIMFVTPVLYGVMPRLPNMAGAVTSFIFSTVIFIGFEICKHRSQKHLQAHLGRNNVILDGPTLYLSTTEGSAHRRINFSEQIIMSSVIGSTKENYSLADQPTEEFTTAQEVPLTRRLVFT